MPSTAPVIRYTAREFATLKQALSEYIKATEPTLWTDFFESNLGVIMMDIIAYVGDILSFSIDRVAQEVNLSTCKRYASALRYAKSVGYRPSGPTPASVDLSITGHNTAQSVTVPEGTQVSAGGVSFETLQDYVFAAPTADPLTVPVVEGASTNDSFIADGTANQKYQSTLEQVADDSWNVYVNGAQWTEVSNLLDAQKDDVFKISYLQNSKIEIEFGDGTYGNRPSDGDTVLVTYRTTQGEAGNISGNSVNQPITIINGTAAVSVTATNLLAAAGGAARESLAHLKNFIPQWIKAVDKAISYNDYLELTNDYSGSAGTVGKATVNLRDSGTGPRILGAVQSYTLLPAGGVPVGSMYVVKDIDFAAPNGYGLYEWSGISWDWVSLPAYLAANIVDIYVWAPTADAFGGTTYTNASAALKSALMDFLNERSVITVRVCALDGTTTPVNINLGTVYINAAYELSEAQAAIELALSALFSREGHKPGSTIYLSDIYEAVNDVDAVERFNLTVPAADITAAYNELLVLGTITATYDTEPDVVPNVSGTCP